MMNSHSSYDTIEIDLPGSLKYLNILGNCIPAVIKSVDHLEEEEIISYNVQLAVHEICTNIALHAYGNTEHTGRIHVTINVNVQERTIEIHVLDQGVPFDASCEVEPVLGEPQVHGYGLFLAKSLMDKVEYQRVSNKNIWSLTKHL